MKVEVGISGVDGAEYAMVTLDPVAALAFLRDHDHEGSGVSVVITDDEEGAYRLLETASNLHQQETEHGNE